MKLKITILLVFIVTNIIIYSAPYVFFYKNTKYELVTEYLNWKDAAKYALNKDAKLVEIDSQEEQDTIFKAILAFGLSKTYRPIMDGGGTSYVWIGANDIAEEGNWIWDGKNSGTGKLFWKGSASNGQVINNQFVNWGGKSKNKFNEPDNFNSNQNAAAMALTKWPNGAPFELGKEGEWNDINENNQIYFVIEYDEPTSIQLNNNIHDYDMFRLVEMCNEFFVYDYLGNIIIRNDNFKNFQSLSEIINYKGLFFIIFRKDDKFITKKVYID